MICKERLEELIKQNAIIWSEGWIEEVYLNEKCYICPCTSSDGNVVDYMLFAYEDDKHTNNYLLSELEEDVGKAKWHEEFGDITRTERLSLPTWEELEKEKGIYDVQFLSNDDDDCDLIINKVENKISVLGVGGAYDIWNLTKVNYLEACRLCKKLFLGEINE